MERTKYNKTATSIFCSDLHLREDTPTCFMGDFQKEQWGCLDYISNLQKIHNCKVFCGGDIFHHWKASPWLLSKTIKHLPDQFYSVAGQHDLPQHNMSLINKSGIYTLVEASKLVLLDECHWGQIPNKGSWYFEEFDCHLLVWHHLTYITTPFPGATGGQAEGLLRKYKKFPIILCGDNHQSFYTEYEGRLLVNPGPITRQTADQIDFQPRVALWYADTNTITWVNLPMQEGVISREHIEVKEQRDARIDAFISKLDGDWQVEMSFEDNLRNFFAVNNVREPVQQIIYKAIE